MRLKISIIKSRSRVLLASMLYIFSRILPASILPNAKGKTRVLVFHHIDNVRRFQAIITTLLKHYSVIDFPQYLAGNKAKDRLNIIIALDDGYRSWYQDALPIFRTYDVHPLLFVSSDFLGLSSEAAMEYCCRAITTWPEPSLSWEELGALLEIGAEVGGHALGHRDLTSVKEEDELLRLVAEDRQNLADKLGIKVRSFAYPFGCYDATVMRIIEKTGYNFAFTCDSGYLEESCGPLLLKRTNIGLRSCLAVRAAAEGWLDAVSAIVYFIKKVFK